MIEVAGFFILLSGLMLDLASDFTGLRHQ